MDLITMLDFISISFFYIFFIIITFLFINYIFNKKAFYNILIYLKLKFYKLIKKEKTKIKIVDIEKLSIFNNIYGEKEGDRLIKFVTKELSNYYGFFNVFHLFEDKIIVFINDKSKSVEEIIDFEKFKLFKNKKNIDYKIDLHSLDFELTDFNNYFYIFENILNKNIKQNNINYNNYIKYKSILDDCFTDNKRYKFVFYQQALATKEEIKNNSKKFKNYELLIRIMDTKENKVISPFYFLNIINNSSNLTTMFLEKTLKMAIDIVNKNKDIKYHFNLTFNNIIKKNNKEILINNLKKINKNNLKIEFVEEENLDIQNENFIVFNKFCELNKIDRIIDDFGSGYSNFIYLNTLNISEVKFDGTLIKNIKNKKTFYLIKSMLIFCKSINVKTVAEFVENEELYNICLKLKFDYFQGYYIHKPELVSV